jgi:serine/threonine-protein kinase
VAATLVGLLASLTVLGSCVGWVLRDRAARRNEAERRAEKALEEAARLQREEKWSESLDAVGRAQSILDNGKGRPDLRQQAEERRADLEMAVRLEEVRLRMAFVLDSLDKWEIVWAEGDGAYAAAFRGYGLDVEGLAPRAVAERIRERSIQSQLVAALDDWAYVRRQLKVDGWGRLVAVARAADPDHWRNRLRDVLESQDPRALEELAASAPAGEWSAATMVLLVGHPSSFDG